MPPDVMLYASDFLLLVKTFKYDTPETISAEKVYL